jgi:hypothetical protein
MATIVGTSAPDILVGIKQEANDIYGDAVNPEGGDFTGANDTITGGDSSPSNNLYGDAYSFSGGTSTGGADTLIGGANSTNNLYGDAYSMTVSHGGNDVLIGGKAGINNLIGDAHDATGSEASGGNDRLVSAANTTDNMWGDFQSFGVGVQSFGQDTFAFNFHNGEDFVYDFSHTQGDIIEISGFKGGHALESFSDLNIQLVDTNGDSALDSSLIEFDKNDTVTVYGVTTLAADDFMFV